MRLISLGSQNISWTFWALFLPKGPFQYEQITEFSLSRTITTGTPQGSCIFPCIIYFLSTRHRRSSIGFNGPVCLHTSYQYEAIEWIKVLTSLSAIPKYLEKWKTTINPKTSRVKYEELVKKEDAVEYLVVYLIEDSSGIFIF